jgi:hypothetical protein
MLGRDLDSVPSLATRVLSCSATDAARLAPGRRRRRIQTLEALREQRGLPWLGSSVARCQA